MCGFLETLDRFHRYGIKASNVCTQFSCKSLCSQVYYLNFLMFSRISTRTYIVFSILLDKKTLYYSWSFNKIPTLLTDELNKIHIYFTCFWSIIFSLLSCIMEIHRFSTWFLSTALEILKMIWQSVYSFTWL